MKKEKKKLTLLQKQLIAVGSVFTLIFCSTFVIYGLQMSATVDFINEWGEDKSTLNSADRPNYFEFMYRLFGGKPKETGGIKRGNEKKYDKDGDLLGISNRPYIYEEIPLENVATIEIQNVDAETGEKRNFSFYMDPAAKSLILTGREMLSFDKEKLSYLYVNTCNMLAMEKVDSPAEDLSQYGLDGGKSDNWFIVTTTDGKKHQVYIGDKIPTGAAYYCKSADKPHIYVIDTMIDSCVLVSPEEYIVPMLASPISQQEMYNIDDIKIISGGELKVNLLKAPESVSNSTDGTAYSHIMSYPGGYTVSQTEVDKIIQQLSSFVGTEVVVGNLMEIYYNAGGDTPAEKSAAESGDVSEEPAETKGDAALKATLEKYGIANPSHELHYKSGDKEYKVIFGSKTEDGSAYYAMNLSQQTICTVPCENVAFLDYELINFVDKYIFQMNIDNLASVEVKTRNSHETFLLEGEKQELTVTKQSDGKTVDTKTFRQFYIDVLLVTLTGKTDSYDTTNEVLMYKFTTRDNRSIEYKFYDISTTKVFFTVDGKGEFYVNRDSVNKVINNFDMLLSGKTFMSEALGG